MSYIKEYLMDRLESGNLCVCSMCKSITPIEKFYLEKGICDVCSMTQPYDEDREWNGE